MSGNFSNSSSGSGFDTGCSFSCADCNRIQPLKRRLLSSTVAVAAVLGIIVLFVSGCRSELLLVEDGRSCAVIVLDPDAGRYEKQAAEDLQHYVGKITGAILPVGNAPGEVGFDGTVIELGAGAVKNRRTARKASRLEADGFVISSGSDRLSIMGSTPQGTLFGVYRLIRELGVKFCWPGMYGTIVPSQKTLGVPGMEIIEEPDFPVREIRGGFGGVSKKEYNLFIPAFKLTTPSKSGIGHAYSKLVPSSLFMEHPEYFALAGGERRISQICTTTPEVVDIVTGSIIEQFRKKPEKYMASICPNDGLKFCECEDCLALDRAAFVDDTGTGADSTGLEWISGITASITDRLMIFNNEVASRVNSEIPGKKLGFYAYANYISPPVKEPVHPDIWIYLARMPWDYCHFHPVNTPGCSSNSLFDSYLTGWTGISQAVVIREYWGHFAVWGPFPAHRSIANDIRYYAGFENVKGVHTEWFDNWPMQGPNFHVAARLLWDNTLDPEQVLQEYYRDLFGVAGVTMAEFYDLMAERSAQVMEPAGYGWLEAFDDSNMEDYFHLLDRAVELAENNDADQAVSERLGVVRNSMALYRLWRKTTALKLDGKKEESLLTAGEFIETLDRLENQDPWFKACSSRVGIPRYRRYIEKYIESGGDPASGWRP